MKIRDIFKSSEEKDSLGNWFRNKRFKFFFDKINLMDKPISILDLGGKVKFWENRNLSGNPNFLITIINLESEKSGYPNIETKVGNILELKSFKKKSFDIVFSNSVIEHLYNFENQKKIASEILRIGKKHIIQTPNKYFFIEPHYIFPFFQYLPSKIQYKILTKTKLSRLRKWDKKFARQYLKEIRLLTLNELKEIFPGSKIYQEKFFGMSKSFTAYNL
tara:strand:- start:12328 stop:12984 length:657 start_codon:yes stop_codon:yes gene_type:complete